MVKTLFGEFSRRTAKRNKDAVNAAYESYWKKTTDEIDSKKREIGRNMAESTSAATIINKLDEELKTASKQHDKILGRE